METLGLGEADGDGFLYEVRFAQFRRKRVPCFEGGERREKEGRDCGIAKANLSTENMERELNRTDLSS